MRWASLAENLILVLAACLFASIAWLCIAAAAGLSPLAVLATTWQGAFGSLFAWQQTLRAATPLLLLGLAVALPARAGLLMVGCEGAFVLAGLAAAVAALAFPVAFALPAMIVAGMLSGALWLGLSGWLRAVRGVHEAVSGLLLTYVAIALLNQIVEGPLRDPSSFDKPATALIPDAAMLGDLAHLGTHVGLVLGVIACIAAQLILRRTAWGFALRIGGENPLAAAFAGLGRRRHVILVSLLAGALVGLAASLEVSAVQGRASATLALGYGYVGILVAMLARGSMLAVIPAALLAGALDSGAGLLQRRLDAPAASAELMHGLLFVAIMICASLQGRLLARWQEKRAGR